MKTLVARLGLTATLAVWTAAAAAGQPLVSVSGTVRDADGRPVAGAEVAVAGGQGETRTDAAGTFRLAVPAGAVTLRVSRAGYADTRVDLAATGDVAGLEVTLRAPPRFSELVTVEAVRAAPEAPVTKSDLARAAIEARDFGQEMPFVLKEVPSITQYSDSGGTAGYSYLSLRGIPQTRMNLTLDGVPLNEPEDSAFYFANFAGFADAVDSVQVQRGVGTSVPGAASFAGSINFASVDFAERPRLDARLTAGSFGTAQAAIGAHSGSFAGSLRLYGRFVHQETDGFRDHSGVIQQAGYFGLSRQDDRSFLKVFGFAGRERTQLAFLAADADTLARDLRANPMSPEERDRFGQRFVQGQYHRAIGRASSLAVRGYYNGADGWYRVGSPAAAPSGLYQYGLDWRMAGAAVTVEQARQRLSWAWGAHAYDFRSTHQREIVEGPGEYVNHGSKNEADTFARVAYDVGRWHHYGDVQVRWARFGYDGDQPIGAVRWAFVNPKIGTRVDLGRGFTAYASIGYASREPGRSDLFSGEDNPSVVYDLEAVRPERVVNLEAGTSFRGPKLAAHLNFYDMEFRDEIALTGELSEVGLPLRRNVGRSARRGFEIDLAWQPAPSVRVTHTANAGYNRIQSWTQFYDVYDGAGGYAGSTSRVHRDVTPLLTPAYVGNLLVDCMPAGWIGVGAAARYVSKAYLDNTQNEAFTSPGFFGLDLSASVSLRRLVRAGEPRLRLQVVNALDNRRMFPSGYSYRYFTEAASGQPVPGGTSYYYPLATRSVIVTFDFRM